MIYFHAKIKKAINREHSFDVAGVSKSFTQKSNGGFVVLFSVVLSSIILAIALGMTNIAIREIGFETSAKNTNDAFFAADTAIECALYYDLSKDGSSFGKPSTTFNTTCAGTAVDLNSGSSVDSPSPWSFILFPLGTSKKACAIVTVDKVLVPGSTESTTILAKGYDSGGDNQNCTSTNLNRVEREIFVQIGDTGLPMAPINYTLNLTVVGSGSVTSSIAGINCGTGCINFPEGSEVVLTATPDPGFEFMGWSPSCNVSGGDCYLTMNSDINVVASFAPIVTHALNVAVSTPGNVTSDPGTINCGTAGTVCTDSFLENSSVDLLATPSVGYTFTWTGACTGVMTNICTVNMDADYTVGVTFTVLSTYPQTTLATSSYDASIPNVNRTVSLPSGVEAGDLLLVLFSVDGNNTPVTWPTNGGTWTVISQVPPSYLSTTNTLVIAYKIATSVEAGAPSINVITSDEDPSAHHAFRIDKGTFYSSGPYIQISPRSNSNSTAPNSDPLTASWGAAKNLWFTVFSRNTAGPTGSYPTNYIIGPTTTQVGVSTDGQSLASARREWESSDNQDPASFGISPNDAWVAYTIVIRGL